MQLFSADATILFYRFQKKNCSPKTALKSCSTVFNPEKFCFVQLKQFYSLKLSHFAG